MTSLLQWYLALFLMLSSLTGCEGHGRLIEPPSRSSMWRFGFKTPINYDDNQLHCGGVKVQYEDNKGKCGVCGDPWNGPHDHEEGGKYAKGIIVRKYLIGQNIQVTVDLTANLKGWFEFRICAKDDPKKKTTHECLDKHLLKEMSTGKPRWWLPKDPSFIGRINLKLQLPKDIVCKACVLQWKYNGGNSWGKDPKTGKECVGCGKQMQFYGCADVSIVKEKIERNVIPVEANMASKPGIGLGWLSCLVFSLALKKLYFGIM